MTGFRYLTRDSGCGGCGGEPTEEQHLLRADVDSSAWDGPAAMSACSNSAAPASCFGAICAGKKDGDTATQEAWALPHHKHPGDAPNASGVANALSRLPQTQGLTNASAAKAHLQAHMKAINPDYDANAAETLASRQRASAAEARRTAYEDAGARAMVSVRSVGTRELRYPGGQVHLTAGLPCQIRSASVTIDGQRYLEVEGYASTFAQGYEMWDMFGPYTEEVDHRAFDASLAAGPDVAFLVNHKGVTMARTVATIGKDAVPSLETYADDTGLGVHAFLNLNRQDVRDFQSALDDKLITEMSFAFMLNDGWWNKDYDLFRITEADINRGDVSGVNYGANPYTTITARAAEVMRGLSDLALHAPRAAQDMADRTQALLGYRDIERDVRRRAEVVHQMSEIPAAAPRPAANGEGRSVNLARARLLG